MAQFTVSKDATLDDWLDSVNEWMRATILAAVATGHCGDLNFRIFLTHGDLTGTKLETGQTFKPA